MAYPSKIPILLLTKDRPSLLEKVLDRVIKYTDWNQFDLWILDNMSTAANKKIIQMFKHRYPFINIYATQYNQLALIQNEVIKQLKADIYIKIDDDILVSENWTNAFVDVYQRNHHHMSFGSVTIPINGFGWVPFLEKMNLIETFKQTFPGTPINQACMDVAVYKDPKVNEFIWNHCLDIDATTQTFIDNQNGAFHDLFCPHRYSIGAIVFSHKMWEDMGGWKVQDHYDKNLKKQARYQKIAEYLKKARKMEPTYSRLNLLADIFAGTIQGVLGHEEAVVYEYSMQKGLRIPVTTQGIVYHFSFGPVDQYLMNTVYGKIKF